MSYLLSQFSNNFRASPCMPSTALDPCYPYGATIQCWCDWRGSARDLTNIENIFLFKLNNKKIKMKKKNQFVILRHCLSRLVVGGEGTLSVMQEEGVRGGVNTLPLFIGIMLVLVAAAAG